MLSEELSLIQSLLTHYEGRYRLLGGGGGSIDVGSDGIGRAGVIGIGSVDIHYSSRRFSLVS